MNEWKMSELVVHGDHNDAYSELKLTKLAS